MSDTGILVSLSDEEAFRSRVVLDYTSRDFTAIRSQLIGLARGLMPEWETAGEASDFGTLLLELFSYMGDIMNFYIDRTASEAFLGTAIRRQSVLYIADMLGYTPIGQSAASVMLEFSIDPNAEEAVTLPEGTRVYNEAQDAGQLIVFELNGPVTLNPVATPDPILTATVFGTEGITINDEFLGISKGVPNNEFIIPNKGIVFNTVSIRSNEGGQTLPWTFVTDISLARPTQAVFTTFLDDTEATHVLFGDNAAGRIPPVNAELYVTYRFGSGAAANKLAPGAINSIAAASTGGVDLWGVSVRNPESPLGGTDPESVDAMRYSIPRAAVRIKSRAVTLNDYADLALQVPGVAKSVSHGTVYTAVHVRIAPQDGQADDNYMQTLLDTVEDYMKDKIMVGSTVYAEPTIAQGGVDALWQDIYVHILIHVAEGFNRTTVRQQVESLTRQALSFNAVDFGTRISIGKIYRIALAVQGVDWAEVEWLNTSAPVDTTQPGQGDTLTVVRAVYRHDTSVTIADPGTGDYRRNHATNATLFAFSITDADGLTPNLMGLQVGDHIVYSPVGDPTSWQSFVITTAPVNNTTWVQVGVTKLDQADIVDVPANNQKVAFSVLRYTPTPDTLGGVVDIETDPLLIPRIAPPLEIKTATVSNKALTANVATLTTTAAHGLVAGDIMDITGVDAVFNGRYTLVDTPTATTLRYTKTNADVASVASGGTITQVDPWRPESEVEYPDMSEEERTHDGLWVKAEGGTPGT